MIENYVKAEKDYMDGMKYKDIAEKYDVSINTVKSWKTRHKWSKDAKKKGVHTKEKGMHTKREVIEPVVESEELNDKQRLFCIYYIKYFNATKAYQKAYECDYMTANKNAYLLMVNHGIGNEIKRLKQQRLDEAYFDKYDVLQKYKDIAFADMTDFTGFGSEEVVVRNEFGNVITDDDGKEVTYTHNFVNFKNANEVDGTIITEVKKGKDGISVKLADKMKAMEMLAKFTDLLSDNDKKRLQEEKLKVDIVKTEAEVENLTSENNSHGGDDWVDALRKVAEKRKVKSDE